MKTKVNNLRVGGGGGAYNSPIIGGCFALALLLFALVEPGICIGANYWLAGNDDYSSSSMTGQGNPAGWATSPTGSKSTSSMKAGNNYFIPTNTTRTLMTNVGNMNISYIVPGESLTVQSGGCLRNISLTGGNSSFVFPLLVLEDDAVIQFSNASGMESMLTLNGDFRLGTRSTLSVQGHVSKVNGKNVILFYSLAGTVHGGSDASLVFNYRCDNEERAWTNSNTKVTGDLSDFNGSIVVYANPIMISKSRQCSVELAGVSSTPADPPAGETAYVVVTNGATLIVDRDWTSGRNRVWDFGNGAPPTIYVAAGRTVTINGEVRGSVGFRKSGPGMLVLTKRGALSGTCEVLSGKVRLEGGAAAFRSLFRQKNALSLPSDYTMLDYIDLSGANTNSCIDTGYVPKDQDFGFMLDTSLSGLPTSLTYWFMGSSWLSSTSPYFYGIGCTTRITANDCLQLNFGYSGTSRSCWPMRSPEISNGTRFRMSLLTRQGESSLGESHAFEKGLSYNFSGSVFVGFINFTSSSSLSREKTQPMHIYRFKLFDGNTLVHDFVPVARKSDGLLGLYDTFGDKGFRRVFDQSCAASGGAYSGSDSVWIEVEPGPGSVYYIR